MTARGRTDGRGRASRGIAAAATLLLAQAPGRLGAQASLHLGLGAGYATPLVRDSIVAPVAVRPGLGPLVTLTAALPLERGWTAEVVAHGGWAALRRDEPGAPATDLGTARTLGLEVALRHRMRGGLAGRMGIGAVKYFARAAGIFRDGAPAPIALWSAGLRYAPPGGWPRGLAVEARYDLHRFLTPALRAVGFTSPRAVHRVGLLVSLRLAGAP